MPAFLKCFATHYEAWLARRRIEERRRKAALKIQGTWRGLVARRTARGKAQARNMHILESILLIQAWWRKIWLDRKRLRKLWAGPIFALKLRSVRTGPNEPLV